MGAVVACLAPSRVHTCAHDPTDTPRGLLEAAVYLTYETKDKVLDTLNHEVDRFFAIREEYEHQRAITAANR